MPHVVVEAARPLGELVREFEPLSARVQGAIVKVDQAFLERSGTSALLPALAVQGALRQHFLVLAQQRDASITVRLHPLVDPERTFQVQLGLALVARWILGAAPGSRVSATNIQPALDALSG